MADRVPLDFDPPVRVLRSVLLGVDDAELAAPTPCSDWTVATLLDHLTGQTHAFTLAAWKRAAAPGSAAPPPPASAAHLPRHWRSRLPVLLEELAIAWKEPDAWTGTARVGGVTMPAAALGTAAMIELIMHGWDLARATGRGYAADPRTLEILIEFLGHGFIAAGPDLFGPALPVAADADLLDQAVALAGRDPFWRPPHRRADVA